MDIYTTCFTLPRSVNAATTLLEPALTSVNTQRPKRYSDGNSSTSSGRPERRSVSGSSVNEQTYSATAPRSTTESASASISGETGGTLLEHIADSGASATTAPSTAPKASSSAVDASNQSAVGVAASAASRSSRQSLDLNDVMQRLCVDAMSANQCLVSFHPDNAESGSSSTPVSPALASSAARPDTATSSHMREPPSRHEEDPGRALRARKRFTFHVSGGYQQVIGARGSILSDNPFKVRVMADCADPFHV